MKVNRYEFEDYGTEESQGRYVTYEDYAALLKERDALAVESEKAKSVLKQCQEYFIAGIRNEIRPTNEGYLHMICDTFADETPATDAAIAAIQAQGVDKFSDKCNQKCNEAIDNWIRVNWKICADRAADFAAQLRKGPAHD